MGIDICIIFQVLSATIYEVDLDRLLQSIHEYLQDLGMEEIRRRLATPHSYSCLQQVVYYVIPYVVSCFNG